MTKGLSCDEIKSRFARGGNDPSIYITKSLQTRSGINWWYHRR